MLGNFLKFYEKPLVSKFKKLIRTILVPVSHKVGRKDSILG
jgi:hypothetical protein